MDILNVTLKTYWDKLIDFLAAFCRLHWSHFLPLGDDNKNIILIPFSITSHLSVLLKTPDPRADMVGWLCSNKWIYLHIKCYIKTWKHHWGVNHLRNNPLNPPIAELYQIYGFSLRCRRGRNFIAPFEWIWKRPLGRLCLAQGFLLGLTCACGSYNFWGVFSSLLVASQPIDGYAMFNLWFNFVFLVEI